MLKACPWCSARGDEPPLELRTKVYSLLQARCDALAKALAKYAAEENWEHVYGCSGQDLGLTGWIGTDDGPETARKALEANGYGDSLPTYRID